jgi:hypothetical protein
MCLAPSLTFCCGDIELNPIEILAINIICATAIMMDEDIPLQHTWRGTALPKLAASQEALLVTTRALRVESNERRSPDPTRNRLLWDISDFISIARASKATDPRDLVYGLLALAPKKLRDAVQIRYNEHVSADDVYLTFTQVYAQSMGHLNTLASISGSLRRKDDNEITGSFTQQSHLHNPLQKGIPTWVPGFEYNPQKAKVKKRKAFSAFHHKSIVRTTTYRDRIPGFLPTIATCSVKVL